METSVRSITTAITSSLRGTRCNEPGLGAPMKTLIYVPVPRSILLHGLPAMVRLYENDNGVSQGTAIDLPAVISILRTLFSRVELFTFSGIYRLSQKLRREPACLFGALFNRPAGPVHIYGSVLACFTYALSKVLP